MSFVISLFASPAFACGGFFCNNLDPIQQAGETVVFEVDGSTNSTTMHVQVAYDGPAAEFAWIVPVKGEPDLAVSNDLLFSLLHQSTQPRFWVQYNYNWGECRILDNDWYDTDDDGVMDTDGDGVSDGNEPSVTVLDEAVVGPYETATVQAESTEDLMEWLDANGYQVPDALEPVLAPYIGDRHNFVALKLTSGSDVGDLTPLALRYDGVQPAIPIQLTSVAATPDMPLTTFVMGPGRAVPTNYLHVELNELAVNWFSGGSNYREVLSRAADEAGGHAFATDFAGPTDTFRGTLYQPEWDEMDLASSADPAEFIETLMMSGLPASQAMLDVLIAHIDTNGNSARNVFNCVACYPDLASWNPDWDAAAAAADMDAAVIAPLRQIDEMFQRSEVVTRLSSTLSAEEMTLDPMFGFNMAMPADVSNNHSAVMDYECDEDFFWYEVPKKLRLPSGLEVHMPSDQWMWENNTNNAAYLDSLQEPAAVRIEQLDVTGMPVVLFDAVSFLESEVDEQNALTDELESTGGCSSLGVSGLALGWFALLPMGLRRRK